MEKALAAVRQLVEDFKAQESYYLGADYQESQVRQDFIDKLFAALGWDVTHDRQKNPYEQEVKIENKVSTQGSQRRADYAFFVAPNFRDVKFFAEAKKPHHDLASAEYYHQAIRYAWNKKTPIAILTDFEEFHLIDCRYTPNMSTALDRKIEVFHYSDYADEEKFKRIFYLFGRDAVAAGSIEKFAADLPKPRGKTKRSILTRGYQAVDEAFLEALDGHRDTLARSFKSNNPGLDGDELTEAVQRTLDRLVFMRFLEDKQIEDPMVANFRANPNPTLSKGRAGERSAWKAFISYSKSLEPKYNGLIFKPHRIIDADDFTPPDDEQFADICDELADPTSPYDFDKIPIWILGSIYERFLGKVVRATEKRAKVEEKPEVRKAGGVYYTPEYIVRYIVKETVGKLIEGKTPDQIAQMAFADIACGSGSFLLEVYSTLIEYHTRWYNENPEKAKKADVETRDGRLVLSLKKLQEILTNNIYGVDIDFQATEVTQLSLYLRLLEDVTLTQLHLFKEKVLPDLRRNIVCGNSLIEPDIEAQTSLFASDAPSPRKTQSEPRGGTASNTPSPRKGLSELRGGPGRGPEPAPLDHLKPMRFTDAFPDVMKRGGFDAIVGNPPYVRQEELSYGKNYFQQHYAVYHGVADLYAYFIERGVNLLKENGAYGIIVSSKWMKVDYGEPLRRWLGKWEIMEIIDFGVFPVFQGATTYTCILRVRKGPTKKTTRVCELNAVQVDGFEELVSDHIIELPSTMLASNRWVFLDINSQSLITRLMKTGTPLAEYVNGKIYRGVVTGYNDAFVIDSATKKKLTQADPRCNEIIKPYLAGKDIRRYEIPFSNKHLVFTRRGIKIDRYPAVKAHLAKFKERLMPKPANWRGEKWQGRKPGSYQWYEIQDTIDYHEEFKQTKILWPGISSEVTAFAFDRNGYYGNDNNQLIISDDLFLLALLNSKVSKFILVNICDRVQGGFYRLKIIYVEQLPIRTINFSDPADKSRHDHIVNLVEQMLAAKEKLAAAKTDAEVNRLEMQCEGLDRQIDELVYELYGITEEERKIVEGTA